MKKREEGLPTQSGAIHLFSILLVLVVIILALSAVAYYTTMGKTPFYSKPLPTMYPSASPVSESDDTNTIESELSGTTEGSIEEDLNQLDASASSL